MNRGIHLAAFIESLNTYNLIHTYPYFELYDGWFSEKTDNLIEEINEELLLFPKEQRTDYLRMVKFKLERNNIFNNESLLYLNKWTEKYNLKGLDFPFTENRQILIMLSVSPKDEQDYNYKKDVTNMQIDFFCYSASLEYQKVLDFLGSLFQTEENEAEKSTFMQVETPKNKQQSLGEKWYALHYLLEQRSLNLLVPVTSDGAFDRTEIEKIGNKRSGKKGQGFYRAVHKFADSIDTKASIERSFNKDWKRHVIQLSKGDTHFATFLETNY